VNITVCCEISISNGTWRRSATMISMPKFCRSSPRKISLGVTSVAPAETARCYRRLERQTRAEANCQLDSLSRILGNICCSIPLSRGEYAGRSLCLFSVRLGKVSLSRVCHPQTSPVPPRNSAPAFLLGRTQRLAAPRAPIAFQFNEVQYDRYTTTARGRTSQGQSAAQSARGIPPGPHEACFESRRSGALAGTDRHI
jgi:hypothetical protein